MIRKIANRVFTQQTGYLLLLLTLLLFALSACAPNSGLFAGGSWQKDGLQNQHLQALAADPNHLRNLYAGDAQDGVFASTNGGATWQQSSAGLSLSVAVYVLSFDIPGKKLYAATSAGLFVSSDSAAHWSAVTNVPRDSYTALTFDVNSPHTVYAGTEHSGALKSSDDGASWTHISNGLPVGALTSLLYDPNQKQLWAAFANILYRSDDGGANWRAMSNGLPTNVGVNALALGLDTRTSTTLLYAGTEHGFFRSTDAGQHWAQSQFSLANLHVKAVLLDATQLNVVYISTNIGVLRSQDNGQNWNQLASGLPADQPVTSLVQGNDNNAQLFAASRGIYVYPGSGGAFNPSQLIPILLVLLFFALLYYFFVLRRRRTVSQPATSDEQADGTSDNGKKET